MQGLGRSLLVGTLGANDRAEKQPAIHCPFFGVLSFRGASAVRRVSAKDAEKKAAMLDGEILVNGLDCTQNNKEKEASHGDSS
jgi:hypothetical protein